MTTDNAPLSANELAKLQLFQGESPDVLDWVLTACPVKSFLAGEVLISSNQVNNSLYLILAGRLQVQLDSHSQQVLAQLEVGQCVGEMSIIEGARPSATVVTDTECRLLVVTDDILWSLINRSHVVARNLLYILSSRLRKANRTIMERLEQQLVYERISKVDALTGLYNRRWLDEMLKRHLQRCHINQESLSLMMLDVDHFKRYNDTYGHLAGDRALNTIAGTIQRNLRPNDAAARFGGEEFVVILPKIDMAGAHVAAKRLCESIRNQPIMHNDGSSLPRVTVSIGVACSEAGQSAEELLAEADAALYGAKEAGRDRVVG